MAAAAASTATAPLVSCGRPRAMDELLIVDPVTGHPVARGEKGILALGLPETQGSGLIAEAAFLAFHYAFTTWPLRKVYMEATEDSFRAFENGLDDFFREEGRLVGHVFWNGRYVDVVILAVYRETWSRLAQRMVPLLTRRAEERAP